MPRWKSHTRRRQGCGGRQGCRKKDTMRRERVCGHEVFGREEEEKWLVSPLPGLCTGRTPDSARGFRGLAGGNSRAHRADAGIAPGAAFTGDSASDGTGTTIIGGVGRCAHVAGRGAQVTASRWTHVPAGGVPIVARRSVIDSLARSSREPRMRRATGCVTIL